MTARLLIFISLFVILIPNVSSAQASSLSALEGMEILRKAFVGVNDFTAEITQEKQLSLMKRKIVTTGEVRFKKPDIFYMELNAPYASRVLLKDNSLTLKLPKEGIRQKLALPPEQGLARWFEFLDHPVKTLPAGFDIRAERRGGTIFLQITPREKGVMKALQLVFQQGGELRRLIIEENNRDKTVITFSRMKKNTGLSEKDFRLD
ncbi:MAG: outer membrane lipoprotein carrier protein LolA [Deltaproteobacteria bacterium]|nr:outer membrane lipoprotein carrier protein LolA [Deltaproteobacteria bacterium]TLN03629.1 MAG: outer membrane lipoprotein carrier protein LolA [bacterium]